MQLTVTSCTVRADQDSKMEDKERSNLQGIYSAGYEYAGYMQQRAAMCRVFTAKSSNLQCACSTEYIQYIAAGGHYRVATYGPQCKQNGIMQGTNSIEQLLMAHSGNLKPSVAIGVKCHSELSENSSRQHGAAVDSRD
jgi:hypothetical protein